MAKPSRRSQNGRSEGPPGKCIFAGEIFIEVEEVEEGAKSSASP
jgi:hypothetical protein